MDRVHLGLHLFDEWLYTVEENIYFDIWKQYFDEQSFIFHL